MPSCPSPDFSHVDRVGYLFGYPIAHSFSPSIHRAVYETLGLNWAQLPLPSTDMEHFLELIKHPQFYGESRRTRDMPTVYRKPFIVSTVQEMWTSILIQLLTGASVTMPHKVAIFEHLDELTPQGRDVGACNTIFLREEAGRRIYCGTNTDVNGVLEAFHRNVTSPTTTLHNRPGMVIGGGGAARSAVYVLKKFMHCPVVYLVNRDAAEVEAVMSWCTQQHYGDGLRYVSTAADAELLDAPGAVVACIPNLPPATPAELEVRNIIDAVLAKDRKGALLEMCYHPSPRTDIGALAEMHGWQVILGTEALIWQGVEQDRYWTGREVGEEGVERVKAVVAKLLAGEGPHL
ncbi:hypothetical protein LTR16_003343 [Cryomyces antarcticus]|uniref:Shikimate dehydrogenase substrate binding N-terminal domain-containing protein n=1 Tax=Cryomyces antarcticus TaxID=329879 RepID=A0ABR0M791_9PEZI|nr:hypothetical protein LTR60_002528 [Cryomyces antarcticus]KAK5288544.1 hypothetical protein LTR16_003343 [Cryomyces antarcticus]